MPLLKLNNNKETTLYVWNATESFMELIDLVPKALALHISDNNKLVKRKIEKLIQTRLLINAQIDPLIVEYNINGKPRIKNSKKFISFSHSNDLVALLVSNKECGIDLEKENQKIKRIAPIFLRKSELLLIGNESIAWIWCIKEAIFKYFGERVFFKRDIRVDKIDFLKKTANATYCGIFGSGKFELKLERFGNYYLAYTIGFTAE